MGDLFVVEIRTNLLHEIENLKKKLTKITKWKTVEPRRLVVRDLVRANDL